MNKSPNTEQINALLVQRRDISRQLKGTTGRKKRESLLDQQVAIDEQLMDFPEYAEADADIIYGIAFGLLAEPIPTEDSADEVDIEEALSDGDR